MMLDLFLKLHSWRMKFRENMFMKFHSKSWWIITEEFLTKIWKDLPSCSSTDHMIPNMLSGHTDAALGAYNYLSLSLRLRQDTEQGTLCIWLRFHNSELFSSGRLLLIVSPRRGCAQILDNIHWLLKTSWMYCSFLTDFQYLFFIQCVITLLSLEIKAYGKTWWLCKWR